MRTILTSCADHDRPSRVHVGRLCGSAAAAPARDCRGRPWAFYEPACQVSSLVVAACDRHRHTSNERAQPLQPARGGARERVSGATPSSSALSPRGQCQRGESSFYSRSRVALSVPAHNKVRRRSSALCGTALKSGQMPTRACSSSLTTSPGYTTAAAPSTIARAEPLITRTRLA